VPDLSERWRSHSVIHALDSADGIAGQRDSPEDAVRVVTSEEPIDLAGKGRFRGYSCALRSSQFTREAAVGAMRKVQVLTIWPWHRNRLLGGEPAAIPISREPDVRPRGHAAGEGEEGTVGRNRDS
jgi:hypothetical protein